MAAPVLLPPRCLPSHLPGWAVVTLHDCLSPSGAGRPRASIGLNYGATAAGGRPARRPLAPAAKSTRTQITSSFPGSSAHSRGSVSCFITRYDANGRALCHRSTLCVLDAASRTGAGSGVSVPSEPPTARNSSDSWWRCLSGHRRRHTLSIVLLITPAGGKKLIGAGPAAILAADQGWRRGAATTRVDRRRRRAAICGADTRSSRGEARTRPPVQMSRNIAGGQWQRLTSGASHGWDVL